MNGEEDVNHLCFKVAAMSRISEFFMRCIKQHTWIFIIFFIHVLLNIPILFHPYGYILTAQDYNPVHFVQMYWHNDIPAFDDSEVGENRSRLVFGTAYFWLPMLLAKLGIPLETTVIFHGLFGLPLLLASIYVISYTLFRNANLAGMTAAAFPLFHFSAFGVNLGYQILFQQTYYYNDFNLVFTGWALASAVGNRLVGAAAWCAVLVLFNPTAGINLVIVLFIFGLLTRWQTIVTGIIKHNIDLIMAAALVVAAITVSYVLLLFAAPSHPNAPREARDFAIQAYGHITPHIYDGILYLYAQLTLSILLVYAVWTEVRVGSIVGLSLAVAMMLALVVMGWFIYFLTIVLSPLLLVLLSPSKILIIAAIYTFIYAMHAAWRALGCHATVTVILVGGVFAAGRLGNIGLAEIPSIWLIEILLQ